MRKWLMASIDEIVLVVGLTLVVVALWPSLNRLALIVPGLVLIWYAAPSRGPFVRKGE